MICQKCGNQIADGSHFCVHCGQAVTPAAPAATPAAAPEKKENVFLGIIGALIGALLGGASIVLFSQLGIIAALSGLILAFCTLLGYSLLGKKLSTFGVIFCLILMVITPYLADRLDWAIVVVKSWGDIELFDAFLMIPELIDEGVIDKISYLYSLGKLYLFVALGGVGAFTKNAKKKK